MATIIIGGPGEPWVLISVTLQTNRSGTLRPSPLVARRFWWLGPGENAVWFWMVVPRSKRWYQEQLNVVSNMGMLSCFVGMLTDSRSFLSYPRHEYFRRVLCDLLREGMKSGELSDDTDMVEKNGSGYLLQ